MKPTFVLLLLFLSLLSFSQSLDYISVRKKNNRVVRNFYAGSRILLQTEDFAYLEGPIKSIRNDTAVITVYDVRFYRTPIGSVIRDTVTKSDVPVSYKDIRRIYLNERLSFGQRNGGPLLMIAGGGYFLLNVVNGLILKQPITDRRNLKSLGIAAGVFGVGFLFQKLFKSDGFSNRRHKIVYVDL